MEIRKLQKTRNAFLQRVYKKSKGNIYTDVYIRDIQKEMKLTPQELSAITSYLLGEKLVTDENTATHEHIFITSSGIIFLEKQIKERNIFKRIEKHPFSSLAIFLLTGTGIIVSILVALRPEQKEIIILPPESAKYAREDSLNYKKNLSEKTGRKVYFYIEDYSNNDPLVKAIESLNKEYKFKIDATIVLSINVDGELLEHDDGTCSYTGKGNILIFKNEKYCTDTGYKISLDSINYIDIPCNWHEEEIAKRVDKKIEEKKNSIARKLAECINL